MRGTNDESGPVGRDRARLMRDESDLCARQQFQHFVSAERLECGQTRIKHDGDLERLRHWTSAFPAFREPTHCKWVANEPAPLPIRLLARNFYCVDEASR